jgi:hypothetical protein
MNKHRPHHLAHALESARVVFVYMNFAAHKGVSHIGLGVSALCNARVLRARGVWAHVWPCTSAHGLLDRLRACHADAHHHEEVLPTHVVICAPWIPTDALAAMAAEFEEILFTVVSHSNVPFLSADQRGVQLLREAADLQQGTHNVCVAGNSIKFAEWASVAWSVDVACVPNLYDLSESRPAPRGPWSGDTLRVGLFGASRPLKNGLTAAAAAIELAQTLRVPTELWLSTGREEGESLRALHELTSNIPGFSVKHAGWQPWPGFKRVVRHMHVLLQPSFTESFNMVTADGIAEGVPSAVSTAIDWVPRHWQANPDDTRDVARVAMHLLRDPRAAAEGRRALEEYVELGFRRWVDFLV